MKKICSTFCLFMGVLVLAQEQATEDRLLYDEIVKEQLTAMALSEEQETAFVEISDRYMEQFNGLREKNLSNWAKFSEIKSLSAEKDKELKTILTKEQFKIYKDLQKKNRNKLKELHKERKG